MLYTYDAEDNRRSLKFSTAAGLTTYGYVYNRSGSLPEVLIRTKRVNAGSISSTYYIYGAGLEYEVSFNPNGTEREVRYFCVKRAWYVLMFKTGVFSVFRYCLFRGLSF